MNETGYWSLHLFAGIVMLVLLGLHMITMHLDGIFSWINPFTPEGTDWNNVLARGKDTLTTINYIILLAAALFHGLYGLRTIFSELMPNQGIKKVFNILLITGGSLLFIIGGWVTIKFHIFAQAAL